MLRASPPPTDDTPVIRSMAGALRSLPASRLARAGCLAVAGAFFLADCAPQGTDASGYLHDARSAAMFYCDPAGGPGGRSPFVPRGGDLDACHDLIGGEWR